MCASELSTYHFVKSFYIVDVYFSSEEQLSCGYPLLGLASDASPSPRFRFPRKDFQLEFLSNFSLNFEALGSSF